MRSRSLIGKIPGRFSSMAWIWRDLRWRGTFLRSAVLGDDVIPRGRRWTRLSPGATCTARPDEAMRDGVRVSVEHDASFLADDGDESAFGVEGMLGQCAEVRSTSRRSAGRSRRGGVDALIGDLTAPERGLRAQVGRCRETADRGEEGVADVGEWRA